MKINGSRFVITGANRGIGLAVAKMAAQNQAHLILVVRNRDKSIEDELKKLGAASVEIILGDLSSRNGAEELSQILGGKTADIFFNNAGQLTGGLIENQSLDDIYNMFQVNLNSLVHVTRAILPGMISRTKGKIINNASVSAFMHFPCASTYAASKAAVVAFTNCLEGELKGTGVTTLCLVTPGVKTRMFDAIAPLYSKNIEVPSDYISPEKYALKIRDAIESDATYLWPTGATAWGLWIARHFSFLFRLIVQRSFKR